MINDLDKGLLEAVSGIIKTQVLEEGANDYESEHKTILKKLHKELPELELDKAQHTNKRTNRDGTESHTYSVSHAVSPAMSHHMASHQTHVEFTHGLKDKDGHPYTHARVSQSWEHSDGGRNGYTIGDAAKTHDGKVRWRHDAKREGTKEI